MAVISGYPAEGVTVVDKEGKDTELYFKENTGIVSAFGIEGAISLIEANPIGLAAVDPKVPHQVSQRWAVDFIHIQPGHHAMNGHCSISGCCAIASSRSWLRVTLDSTMKAVSSKGPIWLTQSSGPLSDRAPNRS